MQRRAAERRQAHQQPEAAPRKRAGALHVRIGAVDVCVCEEKRNQADDDHDPKALRDRDEIGSRVEALGEDAHLGRAAGDAREEAGANVHSPELREHGSADDAARHRIDTGNDHPRREQRDLLDDGRGEIQTQRRPDDPLPAIARARDRKQMKAGQTADGDGK